MITPPSSRFTVLAIALIWTSSLFAQQVPASVAHEPNLTPKQIKNFLLTAKVISAKESSKGITRPYRLTLTDGVITHDASFQGIDEHKLVANNEIRFVDSYKYNIAAYELATLVGLDDLIPVYVERKWEGKVGSLSWWVPAKMDAGDRLARKIKIPEDQIAKWNDQMYRIRVFDQLVYDVDPNLTNVLIGDNWQVWRVDFTRAFRLMKDPDYKSLDHCDRQLLLKLKALNVNDLTERAGKYLTKSEIKAVMRRRDKIVSYFEKLIAQKGEAQVLY